MEAEGLRLPKLLRLWRLYARMDLLWVARGWGTALTWLVSDLIVGVGLVIGAFLVAERFGGIGAWTRDQVVFLLAYAIAVTGVLDAFFGYNVAFISRRVGRGQLDHMLLQPHSLATTLLTEGFSPFAGCGRLVVGVCALAFIVPRLGIDPTPGWWALLVLNIGASTAIVLAFSFAWGSVAFWAPRGAEEINSSTMRLIDELRGFPLDGMSSPLLAALLTVVPAGFAAWLPSRALLAFPASGWRAFVTAAAALVFAALAGAIFTRGLDHYASTGSSRYVSLGHRR